MAAAVALSTIIFSPLSASPNSGATVTDTHTSVRVTATVAPESSAPELADRSGPRSLSRPLSNDRAGADSSRYLQLVTQRLRHGVSERRSAAWRHADWLGQARAKTAYRERETRGLLYLKFLKKKWAIRAHKLWKLRAHTLRDFRVTPNSNAWLRAVQEAQRAYPGTRGWLLSCSASEGGWGRWVPNSEGSGVGGWLQYQPGTFTGFYNAARTHVTSRGFRVPSAAASWYSPLGQALAGGWAITHGMRHHWAGAGC